MDILKNKSKLRKCEQKIYISTDMTKMKREIQGYIKKNKRLKGRAVKIGYMKLIK